MRKRHKVQIDYATEFDLDLAPLLSVMVKLVPVMLLASSFVQMSIVETELPQAVQEAIKDQDITSKTSISIAIKSNKNVEIHVNDNGNDKVVTIAQSKDEIDFEKVNLQLTEVKRNYPQIFKIDINPDAHISYSEIVKLIDEARKSRDHNMRFNIFDKKQNKEVATDYMFPEVVFGNALEG